VFEENFFGQVLMPQDVALKHAEYMKNYKGAANSNFIGKVRNLDARHADGHTFPICLEVVEQSTNPLIFRGRLTEVEGSTEAFLNVSRGGTIRSVSDSCKLLFGYSAGEMVGKPVALISPNVGLATGQTVVSCHHKDGSTFFVSADIKASAANDGEIGYRKKVCFVFFFFFLKKK
jgi:hypothetical protein